MPKKSKSPPPEEWPKVAEAFSYPHDWRSSYAREPSCFNGIVSVRKYRITIELVDEPLEVIRARLTKFWRESDNYHHYSPLEIAGKKYGLKLENKDFGIDRRKKEHPCPTS